MFRIVASRETPRAVQYKGSLDIDIPAACLCVASAVSD